MLFQCIKIRFSLYLSFELEFEKNENKQNERAGLAHLQNNTNYFSPGGSPGLVVMGRDSCSEGRGFESRHRILDGHFFHIYL